MKRVFSTFIFLLLIFTIKAQNKMRTVDELIEKTDPAWPLVQQWINSAKNKIEVLSCDSLKARDVLYKTQVTTRSPMGAIIYSTGGLLIDNGWIRILGSGNKKITRTIPEWNLGKSFKEFGETPTFLLIADDAAGGFFAINGGALGNDPGKVYYLSPDNLKWEALELTYTDFLNFCFNNDLSKFYTRLRWKNWRDEVSLLHGDTVYNFFPTLWSKEGKEIDKNSRSVIPVEEQYSFNMEVRKQLLGLN